MFSSFSVLLPHAWSIEKVSLLEFSADFHGIEVFLLSVSILRDAESLDNARSQGACLGSCLCDFVCFASFVCITVCLYWRAPLFEFPLFCFAVYAIQLSKANDIIVPFYSLSAILLSISRSCVILPSSFILFSYWICFIFPPLAMNGFKLKVT
jgi:hypothetical protein